jgi:hypothetical protein
MGKCGCLVSSFGGVVDLKYCPLHAAAPALLAALEMVMEVTTAYDKPDLTPGQIEIIRLANEAGILPVEYVERTIRAAIATAKGESGNA